MPAEERWTRKRCRAWRRRWPPPSTRGGKRSHEGGPDEEDRSDRPAPPAGGGEERAPGGRGGGDDDERGEGLRPPTRAHRDVPGKPNQGSAGPEGQDQADATLRA